NTFTGNRTPVPLHLVVNEGTTSPPGRPVFRVVLLILIFYRKRHEVVIMVSYRIV
ncbi:unnamed protein product, partial [Pylaiella littoralis]